MTVSSPLQGVRVLDLSRLVAGGMLGMLLADFGADVVKVEQPGQGDPLRTWTADGLPLWWRVYGRNKRSITLSLRVSQGQELLQRLLPSFDVLVESFVPATMESWGIGPQLLHRWHPGLVIVRISGWGQEGPASQRPGFGTLVEAASGFAAMNGEPDGAPIVPAFPMADMVSALYACNAVMFVLYHRDVHHGPGQVIDVSLFESLFSLLGPLPAEYAALGRIRGRLGSRSANSAPRGVYPTLDGEWIAVSASTPHMAARFLQAYGLDHLLADPRFATNEARVHHGPELDALVAEAIGRRTLAENVALIDAHKLTAVPVATIADIERDAHWQARGLLAEVEDDQGRPIRMHVPIPRLSATPGHLQWPGPELGADNQAIYGGEVGLTSEELEHLRADGTI